MFLIRKYVPMMLVLRVIILLNQVKTIIWHRRSALAGQLLNTPYVLPFNKRIYFKLNL
jgi:hypothetical protein